jgi:hypothetical protein
MLCILLCVVREIHNGTVCTTNRIIVVQTVPLYEKTITSVMLRRIIEAATAYFRAHLNLTGGVRPPIKRTKYLPNKMQESRPGSRLS